MTPKRKMANKMMTKEERARGISPFDSSAWLTRKIMRIQKVSRRVELARKKRSVL